MVIWFWQRLYLVCKLEKNSKKTRFIKRVHSSFTDTPACGSRAANLTRVLILSFIKLMF
jgi:hypothetical protein